MAAFIFFTKFIVFSHIRGRMLLFAPSKRKVRKQAQGDVVTSPILTRMKSGIRELGANGKGEPM